MDHVVSSLQRMAQDPGAVHTSAETLGTHLPGTLPPGRKLGLPGDRSLRSLHGPHLCSGSPVVLQDFYICFSQAPAVYAQLGAASSGRPGDLHKGCEWPPPGNQTITSCTHKAGGK